MFGKLYQRKPHKTKAVQYNGEKEMADDLSNQLLDIRFDGTFLWFNGTYVNEEVQKGDWILYEKNRATAIYDDEFFIEFFEEAK
jgi:hypothetical protein